MRLDRAMLTVSQLWIYPIKGCAGIALQKAQLTPRGFADDRAWMVVDPQGLFVSQRTHRAMAQIQVQLTPERLILSTPGHAPLQLERSAATPRQRPVRIWKDLCAAHSMGPQAATWLGSILQTECDLVCMPPSTRRQVDPEFAAPNDLVGFADGFPYLLVTEASLAELNTRLETPVRMTRFRGNIVVHGGRPWDEDHWQHVQVGTTRFRVAKPCGRCVVINVEQESAAQSREPLRTLSTYRRQGKSVVFGQNLIADGEGWLQVGDGVFPS